jgi:eukaryotic-like serine/threonine-protein kinase
MEVVAGRYRLERPLGTRRWVAHDLRLDRKVVVLRHRQQDPDGGVAVSARLVIREQGVVMRALHSPHVAVPIDVVEHDGSAWIVTDLLAAQTLADAAAADGPLGPAEVARVAGCLLRALVVAHAVGIPHGGIRPHRVLLPAAGGARLADFGVDRLEPGTMLASTAGYLAPEQASGEPASTASDLFSLASTLYFALEGRPPYQESNPHLTAIKVITDPPPALTRVPPLADLLRVLWAKDPRARPTAAEALAVVGSPER